jgi:hypothetical protein
LAALEAEFAQPTSDLTLAMDTLREEIKADVLVHGGTIKGERFMAVFNKGRTSWDTERLEKYATAHPEVNEFKKVGEPSVSIRAIE